MTYAIVEASGTQLRVEPGRFYDVNRLATAEDETVTLDRVLFVSHNGESTVGQPLVEGAMVSATVMSHLRGRKIIVYKMQPKKKTRKKRGHRQELTRLMIDAISLNGNLIAGEIRTEAEKSALEPLEIEVQALGAPEVESLTVQEEPVETQPLVMEEGFPVAEAPDTEAPDTEAPDTEAPDTGVPEVPESADVLEPVAVEEPPTVAEEPEAVVTEPEAEAPSVEEMVAESEAPVTEVSDVPESPDASETVAIVEEPTATEEPEAVVAEPEAETPSADEATTDVEETAPEAEVFETQADQAVSAEEEE